VLLVESARREGEAMNFIDALDLIGRPASPKSPGHQLYDEW
jgi:hypothetical protein